MATGTYSWTFSLDLGAYFTGLSSSIFLALEDSAGTVLSGLSYSSVVETNPGKYSCLVSAIPLGQTGTAQWSVTGQPVLNSQESLPTSKVAMDGSQLPLGAGSVVSGSYDDLQLRAAADRANFTISGDTATGTLPNGHSVVLTVDNAQTPSTGTVVVT